MKLAGLLIAIVLSGCVIETDDDGGPIESGGSSETYSNHVKLECNGSVLIDRTFTSKTECESHRESHTYSCGSIELSFSC